MAMIKRGDERNKPLKPATAQANKKILSVRALLQISRAPITYFKVCLTAPIPPFFLWAGIIVTPASIKATLS